jgi:hypothetical protein
MILLNENQSQADLSKNSDLVLVTFLLNPEFNKNKTIALK